MSELRETLNKAKFKKYWGFTLIVTLIDLTIVLVMIGLLVGIGAEGFKSKT